MGRVSVVGMAAGATSLAVIGACAGSDAMSQSQAAAKYTEVMHDFNTEHPLAQGGPTTLDQPFGYMSVYQVQQAATREADVCRTAEKGLQGAKWPKDVQQDVDAIAASLDTEAATYDKMANAATEDEAASYLLALGSESMATHASSDLRTKLGIPQVSAGW